MCTQTRTRSYLSVSYRSYLLQRTQSAAISGATDRTYFMGKIVAAHEKAISKWPGVGQGKSCGFAQTRGRNALRSATRNICKVHERLGWVQSGERWKSNIGFVSRLTHPETGR